MPAMRFAALPTTLLTASSASAQQELRHADEITFFAKTMAIANTAKASCPRLSVDDGFLEAIRDRLHVIEADLPSFAPQARTAADVLERARDEAPTRRAWCAAVFRLYGPEGKLMRGMLRRQGS